MDRHLPERTILIEQVVHPLGRKSLGVVSAGRNLEFVFESVDDVFDLGEEGGGDHILNDAVPLLFDRGEVRFEGGFVHGDNMARSNRECTYGLDLVSHAAETWTRVSKCLKPPLPLLPLLPRRPDLLQPSFSFGTARKA